MAEGIYLDKSVLDGKLFKEKRVYSRFEALLDMIYRSVDNTIEITVRKVAARWGWGRKKTEIFLEQLADDGLIAVAKHTHGHVVTILCVGSQLRSQKGASKKRSTSALQKIEEPKRSQLRSQQETDNFSATDEEKALYEQFNAWLKKNAPRVARMEEQMTLKQYLKIRKNMTKEAVKDLIRKMNNWKPLLQKNVSVYRTLDNWSRNPYNQEIITEEGKSQINEQLKEKFKKQSAG